MINFREHGLTDKSSLRRIRLRTHSEGYWQADTECGECGGSGTPPPSHRGKIIRKSQEYHKQRIKAVLSCVGHFDDKDMRKNTPKAP